jgi:hypothetical protein
VQILHLTSSEQPPRQRAARLLFGHVSQLAALGTRLQSCIAKEQKDALDNLSDFAGFVGVGNLLHSWWADSPPVSHWFSSGGNPADSGAQDYELARLHELRRSDAATTGQRIAA